MAQRIITQLVDDFSGEDIAEGGGETVSFSLDGQQYTVDLTHKNADKFRGLFQDYIAVAARSGRKVGGRTGRGRPAGQSGPTPKDIREWAVSSGLDVPSRGRIPAAVREAFDAAN